MNTVQRIARFTDCKLHSGLLRDVYRSLFGCGTGINPFRKSVYKTFSFIKKASRKMLRTAITKRNITCKERKESRERDNISEKELSYIWENRRREYTRSVRIQKMMI